MGSPFNRENLMGVQPAATVSTLGKTLSTLENSLGTFVFSKVLTVFSPPAGIFPSPRCRCPAKHIPAAGSHRTSALRDNKAGTLLIYIILLLNRRKEMHHRHGLQPDCNSFSIILQPTGNDRGKEQPPPRRAAAQSAFRHTAQAGKAQPSPIATNNPKRTETGRPHFFHENT